MQAALVGERLFPAGIQALYSSDLLRAVETARTANRYWNVEHFVRPELREISFGEMEGLSDGEIAFKYKDFQMSLARMEEDLPYPGGESRSDVIRRAEPVFQEMAESGYDRIAVVTHGGVIRAMTAHYLEMPVKRWQLLGRDLENCSITELVWNEKRKWFILERFNDYAHLEACPKLLRKAWTDSENGGGCEPVSELHHRRMGNRRDTAQGEESRMKKGIILDVDGTLWDAAPQVAESWNVVIEQRFGAERCITAQDMYDNMGKTMDELGETFLPDMDKAEQMEAMEACMEYENRYLLTHPGALYPGVKETLAQLGPEYGLYIVSNCQSGYIEVLMESCGLREHITDIECFGNTRLPKSHNIRKVVERNQLEAAIYVGDTAMDAAAAAGAGVPFVYAAYGYGCVEEAAVRIGSFPELVEAAKKLLG